MKFLTQSTLTNLVQASLYIPLILGSVGFGFWFTRRSTPQVNYWIGRLTAFTSGLLLFISIGMLAAVPETFPLTFVWRLSIVTVDFYIDALSVYFLLLINAIALVASWNALPYLEETFSGNASLPDSRRRPTFFHASVNLFHFTMLLVPMMNNLIGLWVAIELTTLFSAFLVGYQDKKDSWEATWKYLIITSTGIILALLGTMFLANAIPKDLLLSEPGGVPPDSVMNWTFLMEKAREGILASDFVRLSFLFVLVGYGTKAGFAPMHTWLPDGHGEAPAPISALLSGVLLKAALYAILRFYTITNTVLGDTTFTSTILLGSGILSLVVATPFILKENRFKRVLAYHSLEHMGIITFALGIGGPVALFGALLHTLYHAITKSLMFLSFGNVMRVYEKVLGEEFKQESITGILRSMPVTGSILTLGGLALVGTPPFNIFMSEFIILWGALGRFSGKPTTTALALPNWVVILAVILFMLSTTLIFYGLVRHLARLVLHKVPDEEQFKEKAGRERDLLPLILLLGFVILLGLWIVPPLSQVIANSVDILLNIQ